MPAIEGAQRPFWMHQLVEYLIGVVLISVSVQLPNPAVPAVLGLLVIVNSAITKGAAGAFNMIGRRLHRLLDVALMILLVVMAFQPWFSSDSTGRIVLPAIAFVMFFVWLNTDFTDRAERKKRRAARSSGRSRDSSEELGRKAGRLVGDGVNAARRWQKKR